MKQIFNKAISSFLLLTYFLFFAIGAEGALLCFGDEGHIAIELVQSCNNSSNRASAMSSPIPQDECGPCSDVSFQTNSTVQRPMQQDANNIGIALKMTLTPEISAKVHLANNASLYSSNYPSPNLHRLKTVIIRI